MCILTLVFLFVGRPAPGYAQPEPFAVTRIVAAADEYIRALPVDQPRLREVFESLYVNEPRAFRALLHRLAHDDRPFTADDPRIVLFTLLRDGARARRAWDQSQWAAAEGDVDRDLSHLIARFSQSNRQLPLIVDLKLEFDSFSLADAPYLTRAFLQRYQANLLESWLRVMDDPPDAARQELVRRLKAPEGRPPLLGYALAYHLGETANRLVVSNLLTNYPTDVTGVHLSSARRGYRFLATHAPAATAGYRRAANGLLRSVFESLGRRLRAGDPFVVKLVAGLNRRGPRTAWTPSQRRVFQTLVDRLHAGTDVGDLIDVARPDCTTEFAPDVTSREI